MTDQPTEDVLEDRPTNLDLPPPTEPNTVVNRHTTNIPSSSEARDLPRITPPDVDRKWRKKDASTDIPAFTFPEGTTDIY